MSDKTTLTDSDDPPADAPVEEQLPASEWVPDWDEAAKRLGPIEQFRELAYRSKYRREKVARTTVVLKLDPDMIAALEAYADRLWADVDRKSLSKFEAMHISRMSRQATIRWILNRWLMLGDNW